MTVEVTHPVQYIHTPYLVKVSTKGEGAKNPENLSKRGLCMAPKQIFIMVLGEGKGARGLKS